MSRALVKMRCVLLLACALAWMRVGCGTASAVETTFWVWHRSAALSPKETRALSAQGVRAIYWHAGTLLPEGEGWRAENALQLPAPASPGIKIVPVVRLSAEGKAPLAAAAAAAVGRGLEEVARQAGAGAVQIDYDCADRRLPEYATFLAAVRAQLARSQITLSATALAGWSKSLAFAQLQASVDLLMPMFYDLAPDTAAQVRADQVQPLADATTLAEQLDSWRTCRVPWFAGLPNFARVTVFDRAGKSRGHLREWDWDGVCFNPALVLRAQPAAAVTLLGAEKETVLARTAVAAGETVACRWPDLAILSQAIGSAERAGAAGLAIFRLPGSGSQGGWSLPQIGTLLRERKAGNPEFRLRATASGLAMSNVSNSDLPPRLAGPGGGRDRGWQLEVESTAGAVFREASPGEFARVFGHADPEVTDPAPVAIPLARRLTYWFADLRAGESRHSGLLQLAPGATTASLRWRIPDSPRNAQWQSLE